jgi:hypothetical protein
MRSVSDFFRQGTVIPASLIASAIVGFIAVISFIALPLATDVVAQMRLEPVRKTLAIGETFTVEVVVEASAPVNVFAGKLSFDKDTLHVQSIDYNTSIANLWAEEPWYSNGEGTLSFIGGTTQNGGFTGSATLLTITFHTLKEGVGQLAINDASILQHDGLGTDAQLAEPIDALFTVAPEATTTPDTNLLAVQPQNSVYEIVAAPPSPDLNGDGRQSFADTSILLLNMGSSNMRYDLNLDGFVNLADFNILISGF